LSNPNFVQDLKSSELNEEMIFHKYFMDKPSFYFSQVLNSENEEYIFKYELAQQLNIKMNNIVFVGSAQIGVSIKPMDEKFLRAFDSSNAILRKRSDIDVAIVSSNIYQEINKKLQNYTNFYKNKENWISNKFYPDNEKRYFLCNNYFEYFARGWLRVDFLPLGFECSEIDVFSRLREKFLNEKKIKVSFAIYNNWYDLLDYQLMAIKEAKVKVG
jgi:hypothetical protein